MRTASIAAWSLAAGLCAVAPAQAAGDAAAGREKARLCAGCHSIAGYRNAYPPYRVPKLGGQHADYLIAALRGYRSGERAHPTMHAIVATLSDQDVADLAAYFAATGGGQP